MKQLFQIAVVLYLLTFFNACAPGYVSSIPPERNYDRPTRPSTSHVWIDGNWIYQRRAKSYYRNNGSWQTPRRNRTYQQGSWKSNNQGYRWHNGRWQ